MRGSYHIATVSGIPVKIHWSFGLLLLWVAYQNSQGNFDLVNIISSFILVLSIAFCVILHEFGHALTARRFGVKTFDIIMMPLGGIARLEGMPTGRGQEFWVAIAGPIVNFIICFLIWLGFFVGTGEAFPTLSGELWTFYAPLREFFIFLMLSNFGLGAFNLIPAFPMDGGRILRSLLSLIMDRAVATKIASYTGQFLAVLMFGLGIFYSQPIWALIGVFIFFAARQENSLIQRQTVLNKTKAYELMDPIEHIVHSGMKISNVSEAVKFAKGDSFIVWSRPGIPAGYIRRDEIENIDLLSQGDLAIDSFVTPSPAVVPPDYPAGSLYAFMNQHKIPLALVFDKLSYLGVVHWKTLAELVKG